MPLLSSTEACDVTDAFLYTLYGDGTFFRWKELKDKMKFDMEKDYVNWLLDIADHYELTASQPGTAELSNKRVKTKVSEQIGGSDYHVAETLEDGGAEWTEDAAGVGDEYEDGSTQQHPSIVDADGNAATINIPPTSAQLGVEPPPVLAGSAEQSNVGVDVSQPFARKFPCRQCNYVAKRKDHLKVHQRLHNPYIKLFKCTKCKFTANQAGNLKQHMINKHQEPSKFQCQKCQRSFSTRSMLESHIGKCKGEKKGENKQKFLCDHCAFSSGHMQSLQRHIQNVHEAAELHTCPHCDYVAARKSNFKQHLICKHQYESAHKCDTCNKPFSCKAKLEQHRAKCLHQPPPDLADFGDNWETSIQQLI